MKRLSVCLAFGILLSGCNGTPKAFISDPVYGQAFLVNSGPPFPMLFQGSAIQWNADYAVTSKHIPFLWRVAHRGKGEVVFFKHKAKTLPQWRAPVPGETLTASGYSPLLMPVTGSGKALSSKLLLTDLNDGVEYSVSYMPTVKGMSGGPVFGSDNKVVGITVGFIGSSHYNAHPNPEISGSERISVYLSYDEIAKEWGIFQQKLESQRRE